MLRIFATCIATLFGLAFGSFLNVCAARFPVGESVVSPGSHCRSCGRPLRWYENIPLVSWLALRGHCRTCHASIGWRYPLVELAVAFAWAVIAWQSVPAGFTPESSATSLFDAAILAAGKLILSWLLILLAALDAEDLWLPNRITLGGALLGVPFTLVRFGVRWAWPPTPSQLISEIENHRAILAADVLHWLMGIVIAPGIILLVRWLYRLVRHREGIGLGDAKLMMLLAVWLGLSHSLLALVLGVLLGAIFALFLLVAPRARRDNTMWLLNRIPLGTFICIGGILSALWGTPLIAAYLRAASL